MTDGDTRFSVQSQHITKIQTTNNHNATPRQTATDTAVFDW